MTNATSKQVREYFEDKGLEVRIADDGHVKYREPGGIWLEGRWVFNYRVYNGNVVCA